MKIVVTGGAGYIGSVLTPDLLDDGHTVTVIDRLFFGRSTLPDHPKLEVVEDDIRFVDPGVLEGADAVVDLAALSNDPSGELEPSRTQAINHLGRVRICALARALGVSRYVLPSSCSIYGFQETMVDETSDINPLTTYARSNRNAEKDVLALRSSSYTVVVLRQATVYGLSPRMRFDLAINGMVKGFYKHGQIPVLRDGTQWRPMLHVRDASRAIRAMLEAPSDDITGRLFNVGSDEQNYQILDLARRLAASVNIPFRYEWYGDPDHRSYRVSFQRVRDTLGFRPEYDAEFAAKEVWQAIESCQIDPDDPTTITLRRYKQLLEDGAEL
jgi:nucleoside-diphosphate-sugar epimerase